MGKLKNVEKYIDGIIILYCCLIVAISLAVVFVSNRDNDLKAENLKIKRELEAKNKDLKEISNRLEAYEKYVRDTEEANRNTVMDKYANGYDHIMICVTMLYLLLQSCTAMGFYRLRNKRRKPYFFVKS